MRRAGGDRIRVTAQLIDAPSGEHVWAETYDRQVTDLFALQDEISASIAASVAGDATRAEGERARQRGTQNLDEWSLYQLGLQRRNLDSRAGHAEARQYFVQAMARDPRFASALAQLAMHDQWAVFFGWTDTPDQRTAMAFENARRAVALDPREPIAYAALASAYSSMGDVQNGLDAAKRAVELNPSNPETYLVLSWLQLLAGDPAACVESDQRARQLDPHGFWAKLADDNIAGAYWEMGRYQASLEAARRLVSALPNYYWGFTFIAVAAVALGDLETARAAIVDARRANPDLSIEALQRAYGVARPEVDARQRRAARGAARVNSR